MDVTAAGGKGQIEAHLDCPLGGTYTVILPTAVQSEGRLSISCKSLLRDPGGHGSTLTAFTLDGGTRRACRGSGWGGRGLPRPADLAEGVSSTEAVPGVQVEVAQL